MTEDIIALSIIFGSGIFIVISAMGYSLVKTWMKRKTEAGSKEYAELAKDFEGFRFKTNKRLKNLETIVADEKFKLEDLESPAVEAKNQKNLMDDIEYRESEKGSDSENISNMLKN